MTQDAVATANQLEDNRCKEHTENTDYSDRCEQTDVVSDVESGRDTEDVERLYRTDLGLQSRRTLSGGRGRCRGRGCPRWSKSEIVRPDKVDVLPKKNVYFLAASMCSNLNKWFDFW